MFRKMKKLVSSKCLLAFGFVLILGFFGIMNFPITISGIDTVVNSEFSDIAPKVKQIPVDLNEEFYAKYIFLNAKGLTHKLMGQRIIKDVVMLDNGSLSFIIKKEDITQPAKNLMELNNYLANNNTSLIYIQTPYKINKYDNQLPAGIEDYSNDNADRFLEEIIAKGVETIDLREEILAEKLEYSSLFFRTDHHWTSETAFWAYTKIIAYMNNNYQFGIDERYLDIENYTIKSYEDWFLGSQGKRTGIYYAGVDDISLIYPKFHTQMSLSIPNENNYRTGSFYETIFFMDHINEKNYFELSPYSVYTDGDNSLVIIKNEEAPCDKKVLIVKDSFALPLLSFVSLCFQDVDVIDLRIYKQKALIEYIDESNPDIVIFMYNPTAYLKIQMFSF